MQLIINSFTPLGHKRFWWITILMKSINSFNKCFSFFLAIYNQLFTPLGLTPYLVFLIV